MTRRTRGPSSRDLEDAYLLDAIIAAMPTPAAHTGSVVSMLN
jgi:hypothetical protein